MYLLIDMMGALIIFVKLYLLTFGIIRVLYQLEATMSILLEGCMVVGYLLISTALVLGLCKAGSR